MALLKMIILGVLGVLSLWLMPIPNIEEISKQAGMSVEMIRLTILIQPLMLVCAGALLGHFLHKKAGIRSYIYGTTDRLFAIEPREALLFLVPFAMLVTEWIPATFVAGIDESNIPVPHVLTRVLYGGISEEIIVRWGFLALLIVGLRKVMGDSWTMLITAVVIAGIVFGVLHLPMALTIYQPSYWLIAKIVLPNLVFSCAAGYLVLKYNIETGMIYHAVCNVVLAAIVYFAG